ncbi:MAG: tetratricopeptide repeat protein [Acidobacteriota bacterium]|nr:tetratricopeptide repeat protein [Acidobacteriota bacterium]
MLKKIAILIFAASVLIGCNSATQQSVNTNASVQSSGNSLIVSGHSQPSNLSNTPQNSGVVIPKSETKTKWTQSGNPIDTSEFDAEISKNARNLKTKPKDDAAKKSLAESYVRRGVALTDARQYASALGDYRRALKYDAGNEEAKKWIEEIMSIYAMLNREAPKEGEEPPPLPFEKKNNREDSVKNL